MMMALVATALFVVTACDKKDDDDNGGNGGNEDSGIVTLTAPPYKNEARVLNITQNNSDGIKQLRLMESGGYMITRQASSVRTRGGSGDEDYEFGKFTYSGGKYVLDNGMTISVEQSGQNVEVTITWKNGTSIKTTGSIDSGDVVTAGIFTDNLCSRPWKVERVIVSAEFEGKKLGKEFKGPLIWQKSRHGMRIISERSRISLLQTQLLRASISILKVCSPSTIRTATTMWVYGVGQT